jgi:RNA-directed DNA polymerase
VCRQVSEMTCRRWLLLDAESRVVRINRLLRGWSNYFCLGPVSKAYRSVDWHARRRLRQWLRAKHKVQGEGSSRFPDAYLHEDLGLIQLQLRTRDFPWAKA